MARTHGLSGTYDFGCRCGSCREAKRTRLREDWRKKHRWIPGPPQTCPGCGTEFVARDRWQKYCGDTCGQRVRQHRRQRRMFAEQRLNRAAKGRRGRSVWSQGPCNECGVPMLVRGPRQFCSTVCKRRAKSRRKRARKREAIRVPYGRHGIYERDGWRCQICKQDVRRDVDRNHPLAPTIDHIIPLGPDGPDTPQNVQTAHRICNSVKRDVVAA